ncbi:hypothetical protein [Polaromonas eurypsychrophila]|uniref:Uncharacterized protein n=1 Tax=Polaromonas eurypsychrophila TaxID=1614635 RepID=A0A916WJX4_9BURK|nr:hypothetical protein [Polaromonas eurypsychrophila]GGB06999.1 hypothetical protein GCM10011496_29840 [Polaromonas eurypsychrophila]
MNWLARLKKIDTAPTADPTETTKRVSVVFVGRDIAPLQKTGGYARAANDPTPDPGRWAWPHSAAMTGAEIDTFTARLASFTDKGLRLEDAEALADKLVTRDREADDRRLCLECFHLSGQHGKTWDCRNWQRAGVALRAKDAQLSAALVFQLQRCDGFAPIQSKG